LTSDSVAPWYFCGGRLEPCGVAAVRALGEAEAHNFVHVDGLRQNSLALLLVAQQAHDVGANGRVHVNEGAQRGVALADLEADDSGLKVAEARPSELFDREPVDPQLLNLRNKVQRCLCPVDVRNEIVGDAGHELSDLLSLLCYMRSKKRIVAERFPYIKGRLSLRLSHVTRLKLEVERLDAVHI